MSDVENCGWGHGPGNSTQMLSSFFNTYGAVNTRSIRHKQKRQNIKARHKPEKNYAADRLHLSLIKDIWQE